MLNCWWLQDLPDEPSEESPDELKRSHTQLKNNTEAMLVLREKAAEQGIRITMGDLMELRMTHLINFLIGSETEARYTFEAAVLDTVNESLNTGIEYVARKKKEQAKSLFLPPSAGKIVPGG